jgi:metal-dependent amidase/aminoacylase/carboxypeptidase family protein
VTEKKTERKRVDWDALEPHYRAGIRSLKDLGQEFGCSDAAIVKHAKEKSWTRNLAAKIKAKADAKVSAAAVSAEVSATKAANEQQVIDANAELQYRVRMQARQDVERLEALVRKLLAELEAETDDPQSFRALGELLDESGPDENGRWKQDERNKIYTKVISAAWRVDAAKKLVEMTEKLVRLKFEVFGIKDDENKTSEIDELLKRVSAERTGAKS